MTRAYQPSCCTLNLCRGPINPVSQAGMAYLAHESEQAEQRTARHRARPGTMKPTSTKQARRGGIAQDKTSDGVRLRPKENRDGEERGGPGAGAWRVGEEKRRGDGVNRVLQHRIPGTCVAPCPA
jgi:hypothetical protein